MSYKTPVQLRFSDLDPLGHVNNTVYFSLMDLAKARYFMDALGHDVDLGKAGVVVVNVSCDFFAPTLFGEEIEVVTRTLNIGEKSFTIEQTVCPVGREDRPKCRCRTVMCGFDPASMTSIPITDEWRSALERIEGRPLPARP